MSLEKAKIELRLQISKLESELAKLKQALGLLSGETSVGRQKSRKPLTKSRKPLSIAGRKKIREAQERRWAAYRAKQKKGKHKKDSKLSRLGVSPQPSNR